jgi:phasin
MPNNSFEVPPEMRAFAEKSVEQARKAFDGFVSAANEAVSTFEGQAATAQAGAKDVTKKAMGFVEQNIANSFDFAQKLMRVRDMEQVVKLHSEYVKEQINTLSAQAQELGQGATRAAAEAAKPKGR